MEEWEGILLGACGVVLTLSLTYSFIHSFTHLLLIVIMSDVIVPRNFKLLDEVCDVCVCVCE
jgi:hypothetical protein